MDPSAWQAYGSGGQFSDELDGLSLREAAPVWLTQQTDELRIMGTCRGAEVRRWSGCSLVDVVQAAEHWP
jgi:hypothetical protein